MKERVKLLHDAASVAMAVMLELHETPPEQFTRTVTDELKVISDSLMESRRRCYTLWSQLDDRLRKRSRIVTAATPKRRATVAAKVVRTPRGKVAAPHPSQIVRGRTHKQVLAERKLARLTGR